jgi:hypothetical protein
MSATMAAMKRTTFPDEASMVAPLTAEIRRSLAGAETWVMIGEHFVSSRIPDLVLGRINVQAFRSRLLGGWCRSLRPPELRALRQLRPDRGATAGLVARRIRISESQARRVLRQLEADSFVVRTSAGSYLRRLSIRPLLDSITTFELKRSDWRSALVQARAHQVFANLVYVVFDAAYSTRFERALPIYGAAGVGLLAMSAGSGTVRRVLKAHRSRVGDAATFALAGERALGRLLREVSTKLPESRLPGASAASGHQEPPALLGHRSRMLKRLLADCVPLRVD